jgi:superfamily II DNA/RNA helicase
LLNDQNAHAADDDVQAATQPAPEPVPQAADAPAPVIEVSSAGAEAGDATPGEAPPTLPAAPEEPLPLFTDTGLSEPILRAVLEKGYNHPTPIQAQAIPVVLAGRDVMGVAQTGTGKTASFVLPMLDILSGSRARARMPRSLILEPTRELALQVAENFVLYGKYLKLNHALLIGGESMNDQKDALTKGVDVLIATPGRLLDLIERGGLLLTDVRVLVIDEADRMLDMGFIPDVEKIVNFLPQNRQTLFFSATMAPEIRRLADAFLSNPKTITVSKSATVATTIVAGIALVAEHDKREALRRLIRSEEVQSALIFCNRKSDVDILYKSLTRHGFSVGALHGDMAQPARFATLEKFKAGEIRLLVCSDVAARGIDIGGLSHVFNFDVPHHAEDYVHRIGRTGRAGREGHAYTLATPDDRLAVEAIEKLTAGAIPRIVVPGLDVVEWGTGDSRKRRGRGTSARAPKSGAADDTKHADLEEKPRDRAEPRGKTRRPDAKPASRRAEAKPETRAEARPETRAERAAADIRPDRAGRERRWRDEDLGPSVTGFGDDVPAFMLLPRRAERARGHEHVLEHEEAA